MKKLIVILLALLFCGSVEAKDFAKRYPTDLPMEVYTPGSPPPAPDLSAYWKSDGTSTATGDWSLGAHNLTIADNDKYLNFGPIGQCHIASSLDNLGNGPDLHFYPGYLRSLVAHGPWLFNFSRTDGSIFFGASTSLTSYNMAMGDNYQQGFIGLYDSLIISENGYTGTNWGHTTVNNPVLYIQSLSTDPTKYIRLYHDGTNAVIESGTGTISLGNDNLTTTGTLGAGAITGTSLKATGLTINRIPYASTAGLLIDSANLTFDGNRLDARGANVTPSSSVNGILNVGSTTAGAINVGATLSLGGFRNAAATNYRTFGSIEARKENATDDNASAYMVLKVNDNGTYREGIRIASTGYVGINNASPAVQLDVISVNAGNTPIFATNYTGASGVLAQRANGTIAVPTKLITNNLIGGVFIRGYNGSAFTTSSNGGLYIYAGEDWTTTATGTYFGFETTANGGVTRTEKWRISNGGNFSNTGSDGTAYLHLKAGTATASTAPMKYTVSGAVLLTTPETGAEEVDSSANRYFCPSTTVREKYAKGWNAGGTATAGTTTTVTDARAKTTSTIFLQSTSAAFNPLGAYISTKNNGSFVITTTLAAGTETFDYLVVN